jgi:hypothetical protein
MLPNVSCIQNHAYLQRDLNLSLPVLKNLYEHWNIFKALAGIASKEEWRCTMLYMSEEWMKKIENDPAWKDVKIYLYEQALVSSAYRRNEVAYNTAFSLIQRKRNLKPNPYLIDTLYYFFSIAFGTSLGYAPAENESLLPLKILQKIYKESYKIRYTPTIMQPEIFDYNKAKNFVYYSLQYPSLYVFSPRSRRTNSTLVDMRELEYLSRIFFEEILSEGSFLKGTAISKVTKKIIFRHFHSSRDAYKIISPSSSLPDIDSRFSQDAFGDKGDFSYDAKFFRGYSQIATKA